MNTNILPLAALAFGLISNCFGQTYQATGPVVEVTDSKIVIQKTKASKWEFARTPNTKIEGNLQEGSTITVKYTMTAVATEEKPKGETAPAKKEKAAEQEKPAGPAKKM